MPTLRALLVMTALTAGAAVATITAQSAPVRVDVSSDDLAGNPALADLIATVRSQADVFVFLCGGASKMAPDSERRLLAMFSALNAVAKTHRLAVGDGGTHAGIMRAAGGARRDGGRTFLLIGVAPAGEIPPAGRTPTDPNHSHLVAVKNPAAPPTDAWGSETGTMYWLFARLAEGRPSVAVVANGGGITLAEVEANVRAGRRMILIEGSGRAADALVSLLRNETSRDEDVVAQRTRARSLGLTARPELFEIVPLDAGPDGLRDALLRSLR
jgi:hypothetical protein